MRTASFTPSPVLRDELIDVILESRSDFIGTLTDTTSLISSGLLDSLGLLSMALFVEREVGRPLDITSFDLRREWDTIADVLRFIEQLR